MAMLDNAKQRFRAAFETLPERERQVAVLLYVHNLTLREIGEALGVTESRVCQIHSALRRRLREKLSADDQLFSEVA
jgi:RNA polymerase sigma factor for flagellar operon FliA